MGNCFWRRWRSWSLWAGGSIILFDLGLSCTQLTGFGTQFSQQLSTLASQSALSQLPPFASQMILAMLQALLGLAFTPTA